MKKDQMNNEALNRAVGSLAMSSYPIIIEGLKEKGIPEAVITPRENVFTYRAWQALGRQVKKGEHGIKIPTFITMTKENQNTGEVDIFKRPWMTTVFHISQTEVKEATL